MACICAGKICSVFMRGKDVIKGSIVINILCLISSSSDRDANRESCCEEGQRGLGFGGSRGGNFERESLC